MVDLGDRGGVLGQPTRRRRRRHTGGTDPRSPRAPLGHDHRICTRCTRTGGHRDRSHPPSVFRRVGVRRNRDGRGAVSTGLRRPDPLVRRQLRQSTDDSHPRCGSGQHGVRATVCRSGRSFRLAHNLPGARRHTGRDHHPRTYLGVAGRMARPHPAAPRAARRLSPHLTQHPIPCSDRRPRCSRLRRIRRRLQPRTAADRTRFQSQPRRTHPRAGRRRSGHRPHLLPTTRSEDQCPSAHGIGHRRCRSEHRVVRSGELGRRR